MRNSRRNFLRHTGIAGLGTFALPLVTKGMQTSGKGQILQETEVGLQLYTLRDLLNENLSGTIEEVSRIGYNYVELFGYGNGMYLGMPVTDFYELLQANGLTVRSGHYLTGLTMPNAVGTLTKGWEKAVEDAALSEQKYMVCAWLHPDERKSIEDYKRLTDILNEAGRKAREAGLQFCYHNHDFEFQKLDGELPMDVLLENTDSDLVKVELDLYWIQKAGFDPVEFFEKYEGRIPLWHVKDMEKGGDQSFTEVGNGVIDFKKIFANKDIAGMESFFVEQDVSANPLKSIEKSYSYLNNQILD